MQIDKQTSFPYEIVCDKVFYQRLQSLEENELIKVYLFPLKNLKKKTLTMAIIDMKRCKQTPNLKQFRKQDFLKTCQQIYADSQSTQILVYVFSKVSITQILKDNKQVKISSPGNIRQINQLLQECVIITLKLPCGFYEDQDCNYILEGYKFNTIGKIRQGWGFLNGGRVIKGLFAKQNDKVKKQLNQNITYSKNQLPTILQLIQNTTTLTNSSQDKRSKIFQELSILGQNFIHSEKLITNSNVLIPIINFQIQLLCSIFREDSCKNKIANQSLNLSPTRVHNVCINFSQGISHCENIINRKIQEIFVKEKHQSPLSTDINDLKLTNMPTKIVNPHLFLKIQFKDKFQQYYVKGLYEYYHYGDHNFNDQGWGCAYRSLQTVLSWFRLQQKLNLLFVPTVSQIQNLIDLIDCTSQQKLSNSNTWIGATQVSWVVKKLAGYDCRIIHIKDGKDIVEHAQIFRDHLQNIGTPIMYGGGEYAYSIVGINYSWKLGEIMFLILDPHYNGNDKVEKIIEKKGICWRKPQEMFKKGVFYNFCLPII